MSYQCIRPLASAVPATSKSLSEAGPRARVLRFFALGRAEANHSRLQQPIELGAFAAGEHFDIEPAERAFFENHRQARAAGAEQRNKTAQVRFVPDNHGVFWRGRDGVNL